MTDTEQSPPDPVVAAPANAVVTDPVEVRPLDAALPPPPPIPAPSGDVAPEFKVPSPSAVLGPTLWIFGALLWVYTVIGELVVQIDFPEALGWLIVLGAVARAWFVAVRHLPRERRRVWRSILPGLLALVAWLFFIVLVGALVGSDSRSEFEAVTLLLWAIGAFAYIFGRRRTRAPRPTRRRFGRAGSIATWAFVGGTTMLAVLSMVGHM